MQLDGLLKRFLWETEDLACLIVTGTDELIIVYHGDPSPNAVLVAAEHMYLLSGFDIPQANGAVLWTTQNFDVAHFHKYPDIVRVACESVAEFVVIWEPDFDGSVCASGSKALLCDLEEAQDALCMRVDHVHALPRFFVPYFDLAAVCAVGNFIRLNLDHIESSLLARV